MNAMNRLPATAIRLGWRNVLVVLCYRTALRSGLIERLMPLRAGYREPLFALPGPRRAFAPEVEFSAQVFEEARLLRQGKLRLFSHRCVQVGSPPNWFGNPLQGGALASSQAHWSRIGDFDADVGDMKCIWELSRFDWALTLARAYQSTQDEQYVKLLNAWAADWTAKNPLNRGPNWKCGQETAIRMLQTLLAAYLLGQHHTPTRGLLQFVSEHCARIAPTLRYAMAQNNNHGTSEAAGLFVGGAWLCSSTQEASLKKRAQRWQRLGRRWLENRVRRLIAADGSFSQYSLNYHRVVLDTLNIVEFWRRELQIPRFSDLFYERAARAVEWLVCMIDSQSGDAPNIGGNDGARLFVLSDTAYRDYRPSAQLGARLFLERKMYAEGAWNEPLKRLALAHAPFLANKDDEQTTERANQLRVMPDGGYALMRVAPAHGKDSLGVLRFPHFYFRPSHADALHFDLWYDGRNLLRDAGSYSYHADDPWQRYFPGTAAHNTIQFDDRDQMPRLGRFLFGAWLHMEGSEPGRGRVIGSGKTLEWSGAYRDYCGCRHKRTVIADGSLWTVVDEIAGYTKRAILRWRLIPGRWELHGLTCCGDIAELSIMSFPQRVSRCELVDGWESRYYQEKTRIPVLEVQVEADVAKLTTRIWLKL